MDKVKNCANCKFGRWNGTKCVQSGVSVPIVEHIKDCSFHQFGESVKCYCLKTRKGDLICPLTTEREDLSRTFNHQVLGHEIVKVEIDKGFVCKEERKDHCKHCPFKNKK